jgi:hypothetical protein
MKGSEIENSKISHLRKTSAQHLSSISRTILNGRNIQLALSPAKSDRG